MGEKVSFSKVLLEGDYIFMKLHRPLLNVCHLNISFVVPSEECQPVQNRVGSKYKILTIFKKVPVMHYSNVLHTEYPYVSDHKSNNCDRILQPVVTCFFPD